ncbi:MAG: nitrate reductase subunit alpha [Steroidobacteraceae bacterium]|nr:nitrate reductase subunit alpha [Steroidobacteraceae bacterium]
MSYFLDRLRFLKPTEPFADGHGITKADNRDWENSYRARWQYDKIVRSTHGVNCTGSCSWKIYVKNGLVTWETQQTDYPRTRPDLPNHEPRGCPRGASYSWYLYSANRLKYPLVRSRLLRLWREARKTLAPVDAWASIVEDPARTRDYKSRRGHGGFVRVGWDEVTEIVAAANAYTAKTYGPDRILGFSPIPAMSMVSYAAGSRYLSLIGGVCMSFYDWYCDLPPASPQTWGEQTDVPESADWYNAGFVILWGSNVPQTRTPDAHFYTEARYRGMKSAVICPDYSEASKFGDIWLSVKQGTDSALAMAMGHVILKECHVDRQVEYFRDYVRQYTDMPMLVRLVKRDGRLAPERFLRASDLGGLGEQNNPEWKTLAWDETSGELTVPNGSVGFRWGEQGKWNIEQKDSAGRETRLRLSLTSFNDGIEAVSFPYFGGIEHDRWTASKFDEVLERRIPVRRLELADGKEWAVATVYDLLLAQYGVARGFGGANVAAGYDDDIPGTPAWQEKITGVPRAAVIEIAREFARTADKTRGRSMIIVGAGMNHWFHNDMNYRGLINMLMMCGCVGQTGGGWAHYVGQEKLRPQTGWIPLTFALDWSRPPRQMNGTSYYYFNTDQWRYEKVTVGDLLSPLADPAKFSGSLADLNLRAVRMGWLPCAPQLDRNPLQVARDAAQSGQAPADYVVAQLKSGALDFAFADPDAPQNFPRNLFVWRSNLLGSSGKGHEYMLRHMLGTRHGLQGKDLGEMGAVKPEEIKWRDPAPEGKLDLLVTLDFRMCTTALYSDVVLPTATWYEKDDLNTSDMHPFIHPLTKAVDPAWESRSDWDIFKGLARAVSDMAPGVLGVEKDVVLVPTLHDTPGELAMPFDVRDWKKGECEPIPGKTMPQVAVVERDYPNLYRKFTSLGPLLDALGNGGKGMSWDTKDEVEFLGKLNRSVQEDGVSQGRPRIESAIDACEVILSLAPETNGHVAVKAWESLGRFTGRDHTHLATGKEHEAIRFRDIVAQPRKIISSPIWSGLEDEHVSYNAGYTNVHELIPWRTLTGRQQFYQDHAWMVAFGEGFMSYRPPVDTKTVEPLLDRRGNGNPEIVLNWITPHQKWGIHSTYSDNLIMQTLSRGGPIVWLSEDDARAAGIADNDWIELFNVNGAIAARAVVSQRVMPGMAMMYHAQERIINVPGSEITGTRGGIHNSVTRVLLKPTHMIGGYAQLSYGFNYYGTCGTNRDEFVIVRKMNTIDWLDGEAAPQSAAEIAS